MMSYIDCPVQFHEVYFLDNISIFIVYRLVCGFVLINNQNSVVYRCTVCIESNSCAFLSNSTIFDSSQFKAFADNIKNGSKDEMGRSAGDQHFLLFPKCFLPSQT